MRFAFRDMRAGSSLPEAESHGSARVSSSRKEQTSRIGGLPWIWRVCSRLIIGALFIVAGSLMFGPAPAWIGGSYGFANAIYLHKSITGQFMGPHLRVEVSFTTSSGSHITTFIYPNYVSLPRSHKRLPILYTFSNPRKAFYEGPGGDYNLPTLPITYSAVGIGLIIIGLYFVLSTLLWWRQLSVLASTSAPGRSVYLDWKLERGKTLHVVATDVQERSKYAWITIRYTTPFDWVARLLRSTRRRSAPPATDLENGPRPVAATLLGETAPHRWLILSTPSGLVLPASRAEPIIASDPPPMLPTNDRAILSAHRRLLAAYAAMLVRVGLLPMFVCPPGKSGMMPRFRVLRTFFCWRVLIRLHVESHIRRQLRYLERAYLWAQMLVPGMSDNAQEQRRLMGELRAECHSFSGSLMDLRRWVISFLLGVAALVAALPAIVQIHQVQLTILLQGIVLWVFRILLLSPGIFALTAYGDAFRCKRQMFLSSPPIEHLPNGNRANVYHLEDGLYRTIGQQKHRERASDFLAYAVTLAAVAAVLIWRQVEPGHYFIDGADWIITLGAILFPLWLLISRLRNRLREDR
jgi:hypothetical protein